MQALLAFRARCFGVHFWGGSLKRCSTSCGVQTLRSSGRSRELWVLSRFYVTAWGWGLWWDGVSPTWFDVGFLVPLMCKSCSTSFWIPFEGNCSVCRCRFSVSVRGEFRILLCCHFEPEKHFTDSYKKCCVANILDGIGIDIMWENMNISDWIEKWFRNVGLNEKF